MRALVLVVLVAFSSSCENTSSEIEVTSNVTFTNHIKPITSTICMTCHFEGERDYTNYGNAYNRRQLIYQKIVIEKSMPLGNTLTDEQRALFRDWYNQGSKQ